MFLQLSLFLLLAIAAADPVPTLLESPTSSYALTPGHDEDIENAPHQVSVYSPPNTYCGGSIISRTWLVTAAKCISNDTNLMTVRAGSNHKDAKGSVHWIKHTMKHPNYTINADKVPINDVAVIQVSTPFMLDETRRPIELSKDKVPVGAIAKVTGWGATSEEGTGSSQLQRVELPIISTQSCDDAYRERAELPQEKICSLDPEGVKGVCNGDEGSPLTYKDQLVGIVSWHQGCAEKENPDVHTEVYAVRDWIIRVTNID